MVNFKKNEIFNQRFQNFQISVILFYLNLLNQTSKCQTFNNSYFRNRDSKCLFIWDYFGYSHHFLVFHSMSLLCQSFHMYYNNVKEESLVKYTFNCQILNDRHEKFFSSTFLKIYLNSLHFYKIYV